MSEKIGELLVRGLVRGEGGVTEPKSIQINTESLGESVSFRLHGEGEGGEVRGGEVRVVEEKG